MKDSSKQILKIRRDLLVCRFKYLGIYGVLLLFLLPGVVDAQTIPAKERFGVGEEVQYDLYFKWGLLMPRAGLAKLSVDKAAYKETPAYHYRLLFNTVGLFEKVFPMRDTMNCYFSKDMLLLKSEKRSDEGHYYLVDDLHFSYKEDSIFAHSRRYNLEETKIDTTLHVSGKYMFDMLAATMYLRSLNWDTIQNGDEFPFIVALGRDLVNISYRYTGQQVVERGNVKYKTRHFYIDIFDEAFTQSKAAAEIWIGDDENHIPVRIRAKLKLGAAEVYYRESKGLRYPLNSRIVVPMREY